MIRRLWVLILLLGMVGCLGGTRPEPLIRQFILEYAPPSASKGVVANALVRVERFSANRDFVGPEMVYISAPYERGIYQGQRWRVSPADMAADFIRRDLRAAGLFKAVLSPRDPEEPRYLLTGGVEEFVEAGEGEGRKASVVLTMTLLDLSISEMPRRVVFQKTYRHAAPVSRKGAAGFAEAMSQAMSRLSAEALLDIAAALKRSAP